MKQLSTKIKIDDRVYTLYDAGYPGFTRNFTRDGIYSHLLTNDVDALKEQLEFCSELQGKNANPYNGEEEGKIFHEYPNVDLHGNGTMYAACETTGLYLIGFLKYLEETKDQSLIVNYNNNIQKAVDYIIRHLKDGMFIEDPRFCTATNYALKVTYWKDSILLNREDGSPIYPIVYTLVQAINLCALKAGAKLLQTNIYDFQIEQMKNGLKSLFNTEAGNFVVARDNMGDILADSDDFLHMLFFLDVSDIDKSLIQAIEMKSHVLETDLGYRTNSADFCSLIDHYHSCTLWPFEQAIIHGGAVKFGLKRVMEVSSRILKYLESEPEYFMIDGSPDATLKAGNDPQLWTWAAKQYFINFGYEAKLVQ
jgi:glycogen debranching enzyme